MDLACRTNFTVYTCKLPYFKTASTLKVEVMDQFGRFTQTQLGQNTLTVLDSPWVFTVTPSIVPLTTTATLSLNGKAFDARFAYFCQFESKFTRFDHEVTATRVNDT